MTATMDGAPVKAGAVERDVDDLIARSSIGQGLAGIKRRGIDAHLRDLARERKR